MNTYYLYGEKLIENDNTMKDFALSIIKNIVEDDLLDLKKDYYEKLDDNGYEDEFMDRVYYSLSDDISRTDIDYSTLMKKYCSEIGYLLYNMENYGENLSTIKISFFEEAKHTFERLVTEYVWILKFKDIYDKKASSIEKIKQN